MLNPTHRFSDRVENYIRYRPGYPRKLVTLLEREAGLKPGSIIADIGSGTGKSCEPFLHAGYVVIGVEPNDEMRRAAERLFAGRVNFRSVAGRAEATTLPDRSVDLILAGQAFHWFDPAATKHEFERILRTGGIVALVWNERQGDGSPFEREYEAILRCRCPEYERIRNLRNIDEPKLGSVFAPAAVRSAVLENHQCLDEVGLLGRVLSSSYAPTAGPEYDALAADLQRLFTRHQSDGTVRITYETRVFFSASA